MLAYLSSNTVPSEEELWGIFHCMARACLVMHKGTEDPAVTPPWPAKEGVHFDLKGENSVSLHSLMVYVH